MLVYIAMLLSVIVLIYVSNRRKLRPEMSRLFLFLAYLSMVLVAGLRGLSVGTDSWNYVWLFSKAKTLNDALEIGSKTGGEYGFWLLNFGLHSISDQYFMLFLGTSLLVVGCYFKVILKHSSDYMLSFFVYISGGFYTFFLNGLRQGIACAICALAINFMLKREFMKYLVCILLAMTFHKSALIMIPTYFLVTKENSFKNNIRYVLVGLISVFSLEKVVEIGASIDSRYETYATAGAGGGYFTVLLSCLLTAFFIRFKRHVRFDRKRYNLFLNMLIFGTVIALISVVLKINPSGILRLTLYFNVGVIFLWPIAHRSLKNKWPKIFFNYSFWGGYLIYFYLSTSKFSNLTPYTFNSTTQLF